MSDPEVRGDRDPYLVLTHYFDYYEAMGAVFHFTFEEINDKAFQLGWQVEDRQVRRRSDGTVKVDLGEHWAAFYSHGGVRWTTDRNLVIAPTEVWVRVPLLDDAEVRVDA